MDIKKGIKKTLYIFIYLSIIVLTILSATCNAHIENIIYDNFECGGFDCGVGWVGDWVYSGNCEVNGDNEPIESYHLIGSKFVGNLTGCIAERKVNFSNYVIDENLTLQFFPKAEGLEVVDKCRYIYFDGYENHSLLNLTDGDEGCYQSFRFSSGDYNFSENSSFIFFADVDGTQDYCYLDDFFFADISLLNNETIVEELPFEIDYSNLSNVILLFILLFAYLGIMALGFTFKNGGFVSFGFFIGIVLGFMLSGFNMFLTLVFIFMNIVVIWNFIKR